jgi:hypothetical protein
MKAAFSIITLILFTVFFLSAGSWVLHQNTPEMTAGKAVIAMRHIGHQVLLHTGDDTSRVLPVKKIADNTFQIEFQSRFTFNPDSLVQIVRRSLALARMRSDYRVQVITCTRREIIFGYEIYSQAPDIIPCMGRVQPLDCYLIQLVFLEPASSGSYLYWSAGVFLLLVLGIYWYKHKNAAIESVAPRSIIADDSLPTIGKYRFDQANGWLQIAQEVIMLSEKEARLLSIFAAYPNQIVTRDSLLKGVWEDEGVFVGGRTLDVFVSKLRKKIQKDPTLKIINIHKKGYKLTIEA